MSIPIIFMHRTDSDFLFYTLNQAKNSNPNSVVTLIGTSSNHKYASSEIKHVMINEYSTGASNFAHVYKHFSPTSYEYNLFCFQRWFILRDFMQRNHISECLAADTDVMIFCDINQQEYKNLSYEYTWLTLTSLKEVTEYCMFTENYFADPKLFEDLKDYTRKTGNVINETGALAISDMVTHGLYYDLFIKRNRVYGLYNDCYFDGNISHPLNPEIEMLDNTKKIYFINGKLFCKKLHSDGFIKMNSLHFAGPPMKKLIKEFYWKNLPKSECHYFDYKTSQWLPTSI